MERASSKLCWEDAPWFEGMKITIDRFGNGMEGEGEVREGKNENSKFRIMSHFEIKAKFPRRRLGYRLSQPFLHKYLYIVAPPHVDTQPGNPHNFSTSTTVPFATPPHFPTAGFSLGRLFVYSSFPYPPQRWVYNFKWGYSKNRRRNLSRSPIPSFSLSRWNIFRL